MMKFFAMLFRKTRRIEPNAMRRDVGLPEMAAKPRQWWEVV